MRKEHAADRERRPGFEDRAEEAIVTQLLERMQNSSGTGDLGDFLKESMDCEEALEMVCERLHSHVFWPAESLHLLKQLPTGVRATLPSIPWVATVLPHDEKESEQTDPSTAASSKMTPRRQAKIMIRRGAFLPPILAADDQGEEEETGVTAAE